MSLVAPQPELTCRVACIIDRVGRHRWTGEIGEFVNLAMGRCEGDSADEHESEGEILRRMVTLLWRGELETTILALSLRSSI